VSKKIILGIIILAVLAIIGYVIYFYLFSIIGNSPNYKSISRCLTEAQTVINKYGIDKDQVEGCQSKSFKLDGKSVSFIHIEYGVPNDCPSGCFFSHYCAIVEDGKDYPFAFYFTNEKENILKVPVDDSRSADKSVLTGESHRLASSNEFVEFLNKERQQDGEFRWCKN